MPTDPNDAATTPQSAGEARPDGQQPTSPTPAPGPDGSLVLTQKEWADFRREQRRRDELLEKLVQAQPAPPAPKTPAPTAPAPAANDEALARVRDLELRLALAEAGITDPDQRELITLAAKASPPTDVSAFVTKYAKKAPAPPAAPAVAAAAAPATPAAPAPLTPPGRSNTGPPAGSPTTLVPDTLEGIDPAIYKALPVEERRKIAGKYMNTGGHTNPYRRIGGK